MPQIGCKGADNLYNMSKIHEHEFDSGDSFLSYISENLITRQHSYGFRGHSEISWNLEPTIFRFMDDINKVFPNKTDSANQLKRIMNTLKNEFEKNLIINRDLSKSDIEGIDICQFGQHYGLPTPLLDWTYSPYVALFFALAEPSKEVSNSMRCVWALNLELLNFINEAVVNEVRPLFKDRLSPEEYLNQQFPILSVVFEVNQHNRRIPYQQGFFTKHDYYRSLEIWLKRIVENLARPNSDTPVLTKFIFPCADADRLKILDKLDRMNINNRTLFPDIYGSVKGAMDHTLRSFQNPTNKGYFFCMDSIKK